MNPRRDDDALNWAGDDDPTLQAGTDRTAPERSGLPEGWTIPQPSTPRTSEPDRSEPDTGAPARSSAPNSSAPDSSAPNSSAPEGAPLSSVALVGMGILAGMYLLYTIGWFIGVARIERPVSDPVAEFMFSLGAWLAVAAPLVWFGVTFWLTTSHPRARLAWLLIGVVVLVPVPFILGSGALA